MIVQYLSIEFFNKLIFTSQGRLLQLAEEVMRVDMAGVVQGRCKRRVPFHWVGRSSWRMRCLYKKNRRGVPCCDRPIGERARLACCGTAGSAATRRLLHCSNLQQQTQQQKIPSFTWLPFSCFRVVNRRKSRRVNTIKININNVIFREWTSWPADDEFEEINFFQRRRNNLTERKWTGGNAGRKLNFPPCLSLSILTLTEENNWKIIKKRIFSLKLNQHGNNDSIGRVTMGWNPTRVEVAAPRVIQLKCNKSKID